MPEDISSVHDHGGCTSAILNCGNCGTFDAVICLWARLDAVPLRVGGSAGPYWLLLWQDVGCVCVHPKQPDLSWAQPIQLRTVGIAVVNVERLLR